MLASRLSTDRGSHMRGRTSKATTHSAGSRHSILLATKPMSSAISVFNFMSIWLLDGGLNFQKKRRMH